MSELNGLTEIPQSIEHTEGYHCQAYVARMPNNLYWQIHARSCKLYVD
jgi:hypothetical protein